MRYSVKKYLIIILLFLPSLFTGCSSGFKEVRVIGIKDVTYQEFTGNTLRLAITTTIDNPNYFNVKIKKINMDLCHNDRVIGSVTPQMEQIKLEGRKQKDYTILVSIEIKDMLSNLIGLYRVLMNEPKNLNLSGSIQVEYLLFSKTFQVDRLSFQ